MTEFLLVVLLSSPMRTEGGWPIWAEQEPSRIVLESIFPDRGAIAPGETLEAFNPVTLEKVEYVEVASYLPKEYAAPDGTPVARMRIVGGGAPIEVPLRYRVETSNWAGDQWKLGRRQEDVPQISRWPFLAKPRSYYYRLTFDPPRRIWKAQFFCAGLESCPATMIENVTVGYAWAKRPRVDRPPPVYVDGRPYQWHFLTEHRDAGWTVVNGASRAERGADQLLFYSGGLSTCLVTRRGLSLDTRRVTCLEIQMRVDTGLGGGLLFWTTEEDTVVDSQKAQPFDIGAEGDYGRYLLRLGPHQAWRGRIDRLGLIPLSHPGRVELDWIETFSGSAVAFLLTKVGPARVKSWTIVLVALVFIVSLALRGRWGTPVCLGLIMLLVALVPLDFYPNITFKIAGERFFLLLLLVAVPAAGRLLEAFGRREVARVRLGWPEVLLSAFLLWCVFSGPHALESRLFKIRLRELLLPGLLVFALGSAGVGGKWRRTLLWWLLTVGAIVAGIGCWEYLVGRVPFYDQLYRIHARAYYDYQPVTRAAASLVHPLPLSTFLLGLIPVGIALFREGRRRWTRTIAATSLAVMASGLVFTFSRHAWVAAVIAAGILAGRSRRRIFVLASVGLIAVLGGLLLARPGGTLGRSLYGQKRLEGLQSTTAILRSSPVWGTGLGGYGSGREVVRVETEHPAWTTPDNTYLRVVAETGLPGGILWLAFMVAIGREFARPHRDGGGSVLGRGVSVGVCAMAFSFLFYDGLYWLTPSFLFFLLGGLAVGLAREDRETRQRDVCS